jgi:hypothetical protein
MASFGYQFRLFITDFTAELELGLKRSTLSIQGKEHLRQHMLRNFIIEGQRPSWAYLLEV